MDEAEELLEAMGMGRVEEGKLQIFLQCGKSLQNQLVFLTKHVNVLYAPLTEVNDGALMIVILPYVSTLHRRWGCEFKPGTHIL